MLARYVQTLVRESGASDRERMEAIDRLVQAPGQDVWTRAILIGAEADEETVREHAGQALRNRLEILKGPREQDIFISCILDYCFLQADMETERHRASVFLSIADFLLLHRGRMEHHLARIVSSSRRILFMRQGGEFTQAVVRFMNELSGQRCSASSGVTGRLGRHRKFQAYRTATTHISTLLAYLHADSDMPVTGLTVEHLNVYLELLNIQKKKEARRAALANLRRWLEQLPHTREEWVEYGSALHCFRQGSIDWSQIPVLLQRHIEAHRALLGPAAGDNQPADLLNLVFREFLEEPELLVEAFEVLKCLTGLRARVDEICTLLSVEKMLSQPQSVWSSAFRFIASLLTGVDPGEPTREELTEERRRWLLSRKRMIEGDGRLRCLLYDIAFSDRYCFSTRQEAWRTLLRTVPPERMSHYSGTLSSADDDLFEASVEMAGETRERDTFSLISRSWHALTAGSQNTAGRAERIGRICSALGRLGNFEMVSLLIPLALDDSDLQVREIAGSTLRISGYGSELDREMQRRWLEDSAERLNTTGHEIIDIEGSRNSQLQQISDTQIRKAEIVFSAQRSASERELLITGGWISTSSIQMELQEIQAALLRELEIAARQDAELRRLRDELEGQLEMTLRHQGLIRTLVDRQGEAEAERDRLQSELHRLRSENSDERESLREAEDDLREERGRRISRGRSDDPEERLRLEEEYREALDRQRQTISSLQSDIEHSRGRIRTLERNLDSCNGGITDSEAEIAELDREINSAQGENRRLAGLLRNLQNNFAAGRAEWAATRMRINELAGEVERVRQRFRSETERRQHELNRNTEAMRQSSESIGSLNAELAGLQRSLTETVNSLNHRRTLAQELVQQIHQGRIHYDELGARAEETSALADGQGISCQHRFIAEHREEENGRIFYAHDLNLVSRNQITEP